MIEQARKAEKRRLVERGIALWTLTEADWVVESAVAPRSKVN